MITETLLSLGRWQVTIDPRSPASLIEDLKYFGHVVVTPQWVDPNLYSDTQMLTMAKYTGMVKERVPGGSEGFVIGGPGLLAWLGDESQRGYIYETQRTYTDQTMGNTLNRSSGIVFDGTPPGMMLDDTGTALSLAVGSIQSLAGNYNGIHYLQNPRQAIEFVLATYEAELRVNPDGTVDFGQSSYLYNTGQSMAVRDLSGTDFNLAGLTVADLQLAEDAREYTNKVVLARSGGSFGAGNIGVATSTVGVDPTEPIESKDLFGATISRVAVVNEPTATADNAQNLADAAVNALSELHSTTSMSLTMYDVDGYFNLGDSIYVFDPISGLYDISNKVSYRGDWVYPKLVRVVSISWPVRAQMGVYYRDENGNYLDLSEYIRPDTADVSIEVGDPWRSLLTDETQTIIGTREDGSGFVDPGVPKAPENLAADSDDYQTEEGISLAKINFSWDPVTQNQDLSTVDDGAYYEVRWRGVASGDPNLIVVPNGDNVQGTWDSAPVASQALYAQIDEAVPDDTDYIFLDF